MASSIELRPPASASASASTAAAARTAAISRAQQQYDMIAKIVVVGDEGIGKSALIARAAGEPMPVEHKATIGVDFRIRMCQSPARGKLFKVQLWDTAGQIRFQSITRSYYRGAIFDHVMDYYKAVQDHCVENVVVFIVGLRNDRADRVLSAAEFERILTERLPHRVSGSAPQWTYWETSARFDRHIGSLIQAACDEIWGLLLWELSRASMPQLTCGLALVLYLNNFVDTRGVTYARNYIAQGRVELQSAEQYQKKGFISSPIDNVFADLEDSFERAGACILCCVPPCRGPRGLCDCMVTLTCGFAFRIIGLVMSFSITFCNMLLTVLPSFFMLLLLRTATTEHTSDKFSERAEVLSKETTAQRRQRAAQQLCRALPLSLLLLGWPIIGVFGILGRSHAQPSYGSVLAVIGTHLLLIVLLQVLGTIRTGSSWLQMLQRPDDAEADEKPKDGASVSQVAAEPKPQKPWRWLSVPGLIAAASLAFETLQLASFPLQHADIDGSNAPSSVTNSSNPGLPSLPTRTPSWAASIFRVLYVTLSEHQNLVMIWVSIGLVVLLLTIFTLLYMTELRRFALVKRDQGTEAANEAMFWSFVGAVAYAHGNPKTIGPKVRAIVGLLADTLFLFIALRLFQALACDYSAGSHTPPVMFADRSVKCWQGQHLVLATLSWICLAYYIPLAVMIAPMFVSSAENERKPKPTGKTDKETSTGTPLQQQQQHTLSDQASVWMDLSALNAPLSYAKLYIMVQAVVKCVMLAACTFVAPSPLSDIVASLVAGLLMSGITWYWYALVEATGPLASRVALRPCNKPSVNLWKAASYGAAVWTAICALSAMQLSRRTAFSPAAGRMVNIAAPIGCVVLALVAFFWGRMFRRRHPLMVEITPESKGNAAFDKATLASPPTTSSAAAPVDVKSEHHETAPLARHDGHANNWQSITVDISGGSAPSVAAAAKPGAATVLYSGSLHDMNSVSSGSHSPTKGNFTVTFEPELPREGALERAIFLGRCCDWCEAKWLAGAGAMSTRQQIIAREWTSFNPEVVEPAASSHVADSSLELDASARSFNVMR